VQLERDPGRRFALRCQPASTECRPCSESQWVDSPCGRRGSKKSPLHAMQWAAPLCGDATEGPTQLRQVPEGIPTPSTNRRPKEAHGTATTACCRRWAEHQSHPVSGRQQGWVEGGNHIGKGSSKVPERRRLPRSTHTAEAAAARLCKTASRPSNQRQVCSVPFSSRSRGDLPTDDAMQRIRRHAHDGTQMTACR